MPLKECIEEERSGSADRPPSTEAIAFYESFMENFGLEKD